MHIETRSARDLTAAEIHAVLKLRCEVFIVEQDCVYADIDGQDLLDDTIHLWAVEDGEVLGTIRILRAHSAHPAIGRVVTAPACRGRGVAAALMAKGIEICASATTIRLDAQEHLETWYERFGFRRSGESYMDGKIPHVPMTRT
ncbi:GNAT family N-acetyltransferase [Nesterenkonia rhizosphaerae]|uniref:GNAT family N-acetyltransferase n=1 Tax=Nesterenkonia rhizosphaerae TaxID=1348272 RepID=A0ABP9FW73_9MICC